ncbi:zinc finger protein 622-like [Stylonychia lemnae]|uniref:Zinc finger protein 622-like n=1 Tax=Stylonychia lemnae TaxID=5949 RepID=A0A078A914_STYLE|nr:zinc finger protein 622-like [Stylonychia lemnae]|eukprot:CDW78361.1 zinc finger protein 622-like [Stylonychia lemnae]
MSEQKQIICSTCRIQFPSVDPYKIHLTADFHQYNTKRRMANLDPITEEIFLQKKSTLLATAGTQNNSQMTDNMWKCEPCKKTFKSNEQLEQHKLAKQHKKNEKLFIQNNPDTTQSSMFKSFQIENKNAGVMMIPQENILGMLSNDGNETESIKEENEKLAEIPTALDNLRICLFCNKESEGVKKNLDHMMITHSYFIPDVDCIINLKGLLGYIAERIHLGYLCLLCSKQFSNGRSCQQHMMDKGHCQMSTEDEEEYEEFYDFTKTYDNHPLVEKQSQKKKERKEGEGEQDEAWEDVDFESEEEVEGEVEEEEEKNQQEESKVVEESKLDGECEQIDTSTTPKEKRAGKEFKQRLGKQREDATLGLNIKAAELLETGEIKLGNGKIIGTRELRYIYKQKFRMPDTREAVLINKLALEYRRIRSVAISGSAEAIGNNAALQVYNGLKFNRHDANAAREYNMMKKRENYNKLKMGLTGNNLQYYFRKRE